jgi:ABC-type multidrug transport system ATPase subunit
MSDSVQLPLLLLEELTVRYGSARAAERVSLAVPRGAVYALLGRNGAGKSSLVRCLLGQQKATEGRALLFGEDAWKTRARAMLRVGVVPEEPDAPPEMTPRQLQRFCSRFYPRWDSTGVVDRLERFGVPVDLAFGKLSKGQKGHVMLALALGHAPDLLVLDDPTLGLDAIARRELFEELVGELAERKTTIFMTTHDLAGIEGIADRIGILKAGALVLDEEIETVKSRFRRIRYANARDEARTEYGRELDAFEALRVRVRGWGIEALIANYDEVSFERFRSIPGVIDAEVSAASLEEIFAVVAGRETGEGR